MLHCTIQLLKIFSSSRSNSELCNYGSFYTGKKNEKEKIEKTLSPILVNNVKGFAMFFNLSEFEDVGFFDESFFIYFEEIDLCRRLINCEKKIFLVPGLKIYHKGGHSHDKVINREMELSRNWHWMWSTFNYHKKYKGFFISLLIIFPKLISAIFKVMLYSSLLNKKKKKFIIIDI